MKYTTKEEVIPLIFAAIFSNPFFALALILITNCTTQAPNDLEFIGKWADTSDQAGPFIATFRRDNSVTFATFHGESFSRQEGHWSTAGNKLITTDTACFSGPPTEPVPCSFASDTVLINIIGTVWPIFIEKDGKVFTRYLWRMQ